MELTGLKGTACLVTGAGQGIGEAIARKLAASGVRLGLMDRDEKSLKVVTDSLAGTTDVTGCVCDITNAAAVRRFVTEIRGRFGGLDSLVNVAGIQRIGELVDVSEDDLEATFAVNVKGTFLVTQAAARIMKTQRRGAIVTVSSNAAHVPRVKQGTYCASKAAVSHLMRVFALELGPYGIRCNSVAPGATETEMIRKMVATMGLNDLLLKGSPEAFRVGTPLGKNAQVEDVAAAVAFLLSDQAGHITMHEIVIDGGSSLGA